MRDLSIILPTCNRAELLRRTLESIRYGTQCDYEIIVVNGASNDHTWDLLVGAQHQFQDRLKVIHEEKRQGFVKAANRGFAEATGRVACWINDDARPLNGALDSAVYQVDRMNDNVAFLAMFHRYQSNRNVAYELIQNNVTYRLCHVRGTLYANFAIGKLDTFKKLNYFDERYYLNGSDPDLSLKAWHAGYTIEPAWGVCIDHDEHADERRNEDRPHFASDNAKLFAKWNLPGKNMYSNDFDPKYPCKLLGLNSIASAA